MYRGSFAGSRYYKYNVDRLYGVINSPFTYTSTTTG